MPNVNEHEHRENRFGSESQAAEWDDRYSEGQGSRWSGRPNGRLVAEVSEISPGSALDVGCGEGADAIWLAKTGWSVTGVEISDVALSRARKAAELASVAVRWIHGDVLQISLDEAPFDLVSMQYPALPKAGGHDAILGLLETVSPGGLLLVVYHDLSDEHSEHMKTKGIDPADYIQADDIVELLDDNFTIELNAVLSRIDPPPDSLDIADVVLRARRH